MTRTNRRVTEYQAWPEVDFLLLERLDRLNKTYKLGLAIKSGPTVLERPEYAEAEQWRGIEKRVSQLHKTEPTRLNCALDAYEKWALEQTTAVEWVHKQERDPRILGEPISHNLQLQKLLGISPYSSRSFRSERAVMTTPEVPAYPDLFDAEQRLRVIANSEDKITPKLLDGPSSTALPYAKGETLVALKDKNPSNKRLRKDASVEARPSKSARPSPRTSFITNKTSFDDNLLQSRNPSFNDTPATSFDQSQPDQPICPGSNQDQPRTNRQSSSLRREVRHCSGVVPDWQEEVSKRVVGRDNDSRHISAALLRADQNSDADSRSGFSQVTSTFESALIQEEKRAKIPKRISTTSTAGLSSQFSGETPASMVVNSSTEAAQDLSIFPNSRSPFLVANLQVKPSSFAALFETTRYILHCDKQISKDTVEEALKHSMYDELWNFLLSHVTTSATPPKGPKDAYAALKEGSEKEGSEPVTLSGKLVPRSMLRKNLDFDFKLSPLQTTLTSHRFGRRFGFHRFFVLEVPQLPGDIPPEQKEKFNKWLVHSPHYFLSRQWRAFSIREGKDRPTKTDERYLKIYMFAEKGPGIETKSRYHLVDWFLHFRKNGATPALKLFSRINLGLTDTRPGFTFESDQILYTRDTRTCCTGLRNLSADTKKRDPNHDHKKEASVMNDGAARISLAAAQAITRYLKLPYVPSAFQGRVCGAKGMWIVDYSLEKHPFKPLEEIWIEITESQSKFRISSSRVQKESAHRTFDVKSFSRPLSTHHLSYMLIPILEDRGVPRDVFFQLLEDDLKLKIEDLKIAMREGGVVLRQWIQDNFPVASERSAGSGVKMSGGFPAALPEKLVMLVEAGFNPSSDHVFWSYCKDSLSNLRYLKGPNTIPVARSTYAFMIPDPLGILEEGEIQINFSTPFETLPADNPRKRFFGEDVLVARFPAYLPSDVQKVKAVFKPLLSQYEDVVIFSTKSKDGRASLATKLSGGDYDGDTVFVCWEPGLVDPFKNSAPVPEPAPEVFEMKQEEATASSICNSDGVDAFFDKGFKFNMQQSMLGICATWYMHHNYHKKSIRECLEVGALLGMLVDAPKQGYLFDKANWEAYLRKNGLRNWYGVPFYKADSVCPEQPRAKDHTLDLLCIEKTVQCKKKIEEAFEGAFEKRPPTYNKTLTLMYKDETESARCSEEQCYKEIFHKLHKDIEELYEMHNKGMSRLERARSTGGKRSKKASTSREQDLSTLFHHLRQQFLDIQPAESNYYMRERWMKDWQERSQQSPGENPQAALQSLATKGSWTYLKASALYARTQRTTCWNKFPWLVAGVELCKMKAESLGGHNRVIRSSVHAALKPDSKFTRKLKESMAIPGLLDEEADPEEDDDNATINDWLSTAGGSDHMRDD